MKKTLDDSTVDVADVRAVLGLSGFPVGAQDFLEAIVFACGLLVGFSEPHQQGNSPVVSSVSSHASLHLSSARTEDVRG